MVDSKNEYTTIGWREWVVFPDFENIKIKAKIDTGARTSAIHAEDVRVFEQDGETQVSFVLHPNQADITNAVACVAPLVERRAITDSGGKTEDRYVVCVKLQLGEHLWPVEMSLTDRDTMGFRMLLGRTAMKKRFIVRPDRSFLHGRNSKARAL